jgi:hypothetical protein
MLKFSPKWVPFQCYEKSAEVLNRPQSKNYQDDPLRPPADLKTQYVMFPRFLEFGWYGIDWIFCRQVLAFVPKKHW